MELLPYACALDIMAECDKVMRILFGNTIKTTLECIG